MGRGLSSFQKAILSVVGTNQYTRIRTLTDYFIRLRPMKPAVVKASLYRALARLEARGILERVRFTEGRRSVPAIEMKMQKVTDREK
jgi:Fe2+ or Zn2+ uptake regulation protein